jgi:Glycoside hydrolase family 44
LRARFWFALSAALLLTACVDKKTEPTQQPRKRGSIELDPVLAGRKAFVRLDCTAEQPSINPLVYGIARGVWTSGETAHRVGGNTMSRLNWDAGNIWNTGNDWFFENVRGDAGGLRGWLEEAQRHGVQMALTVPTLGWVAKDDTSVGFPVAKFGKQQKHDPNRPEAGNGVSEAGKPLKPGDPSLTSEPAPPERIRRWLEALRARDRQTGKRSAHIYMLDNEPDLWHHTHRDVHPEPLGYQELMKRTIEYGTVVRETDPEGLIAGPASWGWPGYFFSARDQESRWSKPDRAASGDLPLLAYYLRQLAAHEKKTGVRILDLLDVHYYPQAQGVYGPDADASTARLRIRSTRSLWDPTYEDESWINDRVRLLPRLKEWIAQHYPGRGIVLGEWSFGGEQHISGGLATAEALGRFGQHGVTAAFYWGGPSEGTPTYWAFRAYRNYDGKGARFQDYSVRASTAEGLSAFASRDAQQSKFVVIVINFDEKEPVNLEIEASSCGSLRTLREFTYSGEATGPRLEGDADGRGSPPLPAMSLRVVELARKP